jgi:hypothetical protein
MTQSIVLSGTGGDTYRTMLDRNLRRIRPRAIGVVSAFVSAAGMKDLSRIAEHAGSLDCRLVAGTDHAVTHPRALSLAIDHGWHVRLGRAVDRRGIFHPKLLVAGMNFGRDGVVRDISFLYIGSSNLTAGGLDRNVECGLMADDRDCTDSASAIFAQIWSAARPATPRELLDYSAHFAECSRKRSLSELLSLGIGDVNRFPTGLAYLAQETPPSDPAIELRFAVAAWAGLQSFTGAFRFQVEFPRRAGEVIAMLSRPHTGLHGQVDVYCPEDGSTRTMQYRFYADNSMFRLNIPNDVPGVAWARQNHTGLAIVERGIAGGAPLSLRILEPGREADDIAGRSVALGTWGRTRTRTYGWF